jgi:putative restriction endonuclease
MRVGNNGLLLAPNLDHLFDEGDISFSDVGNMIVSRRRTKNVFAAWGISQRVKMHPFRPAQIAAPQNPAANKA